MLYSNSYTYDLDKLESITHNGFSYEFTYDSFGNPYQVKVAGATLITNTYQSNNGLLETSTYGNGAVVSYEYDEYHRVITKSVDSVLKFEYTYDNQGNLSSVIDHSGSTDVTYSYFYDFMNRLTKVNGSNTHKMLFTYDSYGRVDSLTNTINGTSYKNEYDYGDKNVEGEIPGLIYNVKLNSVNQLSYAFDQLARLSTRTIATSTPFTTTYTYLDGSAANSTTTLLASMTNGTNAAFNYTYDSSGNILTISEGTTLKASYTYDKMNQLISENNAYSSKSIDYVYDIGGNITSRTEYNYTGGVRGTLIKTYTYNYTSSWKDQLETISCTGTDCPVEQNFTYDTIGNPLTYRNGLSFTWANGRELATVTNNGVSGSYTYNDSGIRTSKTYNGITTNYFLNGSSIVKQITGDKILDFFYDENGNLYGFKEDGAMYYYVRNGQSDIIGILDSTSNQVVSYTYDSWGNPLTPTGSLASTIGADNPFRYRGYYFDSNTGLYYLNSRYYDSTVGRFISSDTIFTTTSDIIGLNLSVYCRNNPVNCSDSSGYFGEDLLSLGADLVKGIGQTLSAIRAVIEVPFTALKITVACGVGLATGAASLDDIRYDFEHTNFFNNDPENVLASKVFAFMNGAPVIRFSGKIDSFSVAGTIMLNTNADEKGEGKETVQHEYGHYIQETFMGTPHYLLKIAAPSLYGYFTVPYCDYFSQPWERSADYFGEANRENYQYKEGSDYWAGLYFMIP